MEPIKVPYDYEYEAKVREELTDPPPLPNIDEEIAYEGHITPGCYMTRKTRSE